MTSMAYELPLILSGGTGNVVPRSHSRASFFVSFSYFFNVCVSIVSGMFAIANFTHSRIGFGQIKAIGAIFVTLWAVRFGRIFVGQRTDATTFLNHICVIFSFVSQKQMIRVYAWRIVTLMQDTGRFIKRTVFKLIRDTVGEFGFSAFAPRHNPVTKLLAVSDPFPALTVDRMNGSALIDFFIKTFKQRFHFSHSRA